MKVTDEAIAEWRAHPVSIALRDGLQWWLERQKDAAMEAYWRGEPWPEAERLALLRERALWSDLFESSADEIGKMMERMNEAG
jgi:hypothetical protein